MTRSTSWLLFLTTVFATWEDSAENPAVFCYRMCWGIYLNLRSRALSQFPFLRGTKPLAGIHSPPPSHPLRP